MDKFQSNILRDSQILIDKNYIWFFLATKILQMFMSYMLNAIFTNKFVRYKFNFL